MAARLAEIGDPLEKIREQLYSVVGVLEDNLRVWETFEKSKSNVDELTQQLSVFQDSSKHIEKLSSFESRLRVIEQEKQQLSDAKNDLYDFADGVEKSIVNELRLLEKWLNHCSDVFSIPENVDQDLTKAIAEYRDIARIYTVPNDSPFHFTCENTPWFSSKRRILCALKDVLNSSTFNGTVTSLFKQLFHPPLHPLMDKSTSTLLQNALVEAEMNFNAVKSQHFIPSTFVFDLPSLLSQSENTLTAFISEQDALLIMPAFKLALIRNLTTWIHSMFTLEPMEHIDILHQHVSAVACAFSVLDPSGNSAAIPFWAGHDADANCEVQFFLTIYHFIAKVVELRDNLCNLLLSRLELTIPEASQKDLDLLDCIQHVMLNGEGVEIIQSEVNQLLIDNSGSPVAKVFLAIHLALLNAASELSELCQRLNDYPITAVLWVRVDVISRAIATLQSRCTVDQGATSLWGWHPINSQGGTTTWLDEVYTAGMTVMVKVAMEISQLWIGIRNGKLQHSIPSASYITIVEEQFINHLSNRLALVSESVLACGRLLLSLLEESGFSVRQAVIEIDRTIPLPHLRGHSTVFVNRMIQSAELFALNTQPQEVHGLSSMAGSVLMSMFSATNSHIHMAVAAKQIHALEMHFKMIRKMKVAFDWLHNYDDKSETSLFSFLNRLEMTVAKVKRENVHLSSATREFCELGDAICSAENDRLR